MGASDQDEPPTEVRLRLGGRLADYPCRLEAAIGGEHGFALSGEITVEQPLGSFLKALYHHFEGSAEDQPTPFDAVAFPDFDVPSPRISYIGETGTFLIGLVTEIRLGKDAPIEAIGLAFGFGSVGGKAVPPAGPPKRRYVAGIRSTTPIKLAGIAGKGSGIIGNLLGESSISRIGIVYASEAIAEPIALFGGRGGGTGEFSSRLVVHRPVRHRAVVYRHRVAGAGGREGSAAGDNAGGQAGGGSRPKPEKGGPLRYWKELDKTIGPLQFRRIGGEWDGEQGKLGILLDAAMTLAGLSVGLAGLCVRVEPSKLTKLKFEDLEFGLDGMELSFARGPVAISGALLKTRDGGRVGYAGQASIRAATFTIAAIGGYSTTADEQPAFFIFGAYAGILGGPPCFVIEGIAAGFGYNRAIALPDIDEVRDFPLVSIVLGKSEGSSTNALEQLGSANRFPAVTGQYWIAAGVKFTSFKLVEAFALITVQFGTRFEIALLGIATLRQPPAPVPRALVYVEMALKVRFAPDDGLLSVMAQLTVNSYLFDTRCKLTGGFAFCIWFKPTNPKFENRAGDFVVTLGGYHPKFQVPAHYPKVPRVGFNWQLPECGVTIKGEAYFALTPSFIMAGARLSAVFRSGDFSAWFEAHADFLIGWAPLHYEAEVGVRIGAAFVLRLGSLSATLSFELGALLRIWGPPFAGEAYVDLGIVAFTVPIGDRKAARTPPKLYWDEFSKQFLPPKPLGIAIVSGLIEEREGEGGYVIVNPSELCLAVESFVPITEVNRKLDKAFTMDLGIRPMREAKLASPLELKFSSDENMVYRPTLKSAPEALWSGKPMPDARTATALKVNVIEGVLMGIQVLPAECREFARQDVTVGIEAKPVDLPARPTRKWENAPYVEPNVRLEPFRKAWRKPDAAVIVRCAAPGSICRRTPSFLRRRPATRPAFGWRGRCWCRSASCRRCRPEPEP